MDAARGLIVKLPHGLVAMRISALASSTIARASTKRKGEGARCGRIARCYCTYAWQESCQARASIRRHTRRSIHGDVPPVMPGNPHLLPSVTFPLYDCTLDSPMRAPADALWEVSRCMGAFVRSNGPQASTQASMWSPGIAILPRKTRAIFTCLCVPPWHWRGQHACSCLPECSYTLEEHFRMSGHTTAGSLAGVAVSCHDGGGPSRIGLRYPCTEVFPPPPACAALWTRDRRRVSPGRQRRRSPLQSHLLDLADPVGPYRRVMEEGRTLRRRVSLGQPFEGVAQDLVRERHLIRWEVAFEHTPVRAKLLNTRGYKGRYRRG